MNRIHYLWLDRNYLVKRRGEALLRWIAWRLPRKLVMWAYFRVVAHATTGQWSSQIVPDLTAMDAIKRWDEPHK